MSFLIKQLIADSYLKTPRITKAFLKIKRKDFLPSGVKFQAELDHPLSIGYSATNSQPSVVAFMLELMQPNIGDKILDIGSGSGWTSSLLAEIVGARGKVFAVERVKELKDMGENFAKKYKFTNLKFYHTNGAGGLPKEAPFDKILVSASVKIIPKNLKKQLKIGGKMLIPTDARDIRLIEKISEKDFKQSIYKGFIFVPLID